MGTSYRRRGIRRADRISRRPIGARGFASAQRGAGGPSTPDATRNEWENTTEYRHQQILVLLEQFKAMNTGISVRIDLEQKNMAVATVLMTGITGFLLTYWSQHDLNAIRTGEIGVLVPVMSLMLAIFCLRHLDHEANIVDSAAYINQQIRIRLQPIVGDILDYESYIQEARERRGKRLTFVFLLGNELAILSSMFISTLVLSSLIFWTTADYGGGAQMLYSVIFWFDYCLAVMVVYSAIRSIKNYYRIESD